MIISVDFDGVIVEDGYYPNVGRLIEGAKETLQYLHDNGHIIIINTCRVDQEAGIARDFLIQNNIKFDYINNNHPTEILKYGKDSRKISADVYIDDKSLVPFDNWKNTLVLLKQMPLWKSTKLSKQVWNLKQQLEANNFKRFTVEERFNTLFHMIISFIYKEQLYTNKMGRFLFNIIKKAQ